MNAPLEVLRRLQVSRATLTPRQVVRRGTLVGAAVGGALALIGHVFVRLACSNVGLPHEEHSRACDGSSWGFRVDATLTLGSAAMGLGLSTALQHGLSDRWVSVRLPRSEIPASRVDASDGH